MTSQNLKTADLLGLEPPHAVLGSRQAMAKAAQAQRRALNAAVEAILEVGAASVDSVEERAAAGIILSLEALLSTDERSAEELLQERLRQVDRRRQLRKLQPATIRGFNDEPAQLKPGQRVTVLPMTTARAVEHGEVVSIMTPDPAFPKAQRVTVAFDDGTRCSVPAFRVEAEQERQLSAEQQARYDEAERCGASHADAMEAALYY